ncbi:MAG: gamma-glutamyltransferase, partial [Gammaproteobacteria bacterium]
MRVILARFDRLAVATLLLALLTACDGHRTVPGVPPARQSEDARTASRYMVAAADPHAVEAGLAVLRRGGNAMDAAVAVQLVLGFVEFPETGLGGGGFLLYRDGASGHLQVYDGRETAPAAAQPDRFQLLGLPLPWPLAVVSGRAVGVPGLVAMLASAHHAHGTLPWDELVPPAAVLAERGVAPPPRLVRQADTAPLLRAFGDVGGYLDRALEATPPRLVNRDYAATLRLLAREGPGAFYRAPLAGAVVARARARPWLPSDLTLADFAAYRARERAALCAPYRHYRVCSIGPPSSGGLALL